MEKLKEYLDKVGYEFISPIQLEEGEEVTIKGEVFKGKGTLYPIFIPESGKGERNER